MIPSIVFIPNLSFTHSFKYNGHSTKILVLFQFLNKVAHEIVSLASGLVPFLIFNYHYCSDESNFGTTRHPL